MPVMLHMRCVEFMSEGWNIVFLLMHNNFQCALRRGNSIFTGENIKSRNPKWIFGAHIPRIYHVSLDCIWKHVEVALHRCLNNVLQHF